MKETMIPASGCVLFFVNTTRMNETYPDLYLSGHTDWERPVVGIVSRPGDRFLPDRQPIIVSDQGEFQTPGEYVAGLGKRAEEYVSYQYSCDSPIDPDDRNAFAPHIGRYSDHA